MITLQRLAARHAVGSLWSRPTLRSPLDTVEIHDSPRPGLIRRLGISALLAWSALTGLSAIQPALMPPTVAAPVQMLVKATVPTPVRQFMVGMIDDDKPDAPLDYGKLYLVNEAGQEQVLAHNGQTSSDRDNLPPSAVKNGRVYIEIEGIGGDDDESTARFHHLMQNDDPGYINVHQPIVGVHEGTPYIFQKDLIKMARENAMLKTMEGGGQPPSTAQVVRVDPSVKTLHDVVEQQLKEGHQAFLVPYSGGGMVTAVALNLLAHEGFSDAINQHVRVMSLAGVGAPEDYEAAGVQPRNVLYLADPRDVMGDFGKVYLPPHHLLKDVATIGHEVLQTGRDVFNAEAFHATDHIFAHNMVNGHQTLQDFVDGGPGGRDFR